MSLNESLEFLRTQSSTHTQYAHPEGNNINMWLGFKHIMYAAEVALLAHLRQAGVGIRTLFEEHGLVAEIVACDGRILHALKLDELLRTEIQPAPARRQAPGCLDFAVTHWVEREGKPLKAYSGHLRLRLRRDASLGFAPQTGHASALLPYITDQATDVAPRDMAQRADVGPSVSYEMQVPYYYCHGNERMKMSAYLRLMEQADAEFCAARGIPIVRLLDEQRWIPAVPSASVSLLGEVRMNDQLRITYGVVDIVKNFTYKSLFQCHVKRDGEWQPVAIGEIVHAYAEIKSRVDWSMVNFDDRVMAAITA